ncbi:hypothetical protein NDU88_005557 [Pleurodeles waltl]|uniref:Uncharacterized protein n=1 Tax=Pleurodeles waltl TaxID=8319 RepID=A0AAV7M9N0_PLEWA|nr:hypothetical protein NDU88_005557 [Pleurodeles waltl]
MSPPHRIRAAGPVHVFGLRGGTMPGDEMDAAGALGRVRIFQLYLRGDMTVPRCKTLTSPADFVHYLSEHYDAASNSVCTTDQIAPLTGSVTRGPERKHPMLAAPNVNLCQTHLKCTRYIHELNSHIFACTPA